MLRQLQRQVITPSKADANHLQLQVDSFPTYIGGLQSFHYGILVPVTGSSEGNLILTFVPGLSSEEFKYEVVRTDGSGNTELFDADYKEGVCTCRVRTIPYEKVTFTAKISDGDITLSQSLFSVTDEGDNSYTHEELWNISKIS